MKVNLVGVPDRVFTAMIFDPVNDFPWIAGVRRTTPFQLMQTESRKARARILALSSYHYLPPAPNAQLIEIKFGNWIVQDRHKGEYAIAKDTATMLEVFQPYDFADVEYLGIVKRRRKEAFGPAASTRGPIADHDTAL